MFWKNEFSILADESKSCRKSPLVSMFSALPTVVVLTVTIEFFTKSKVEEKFLATNVSICNLDLVAEIIGYIS